MNITTEMQIVALNSLLNNFMYQVFSRFFSVSYISSTSLAYQYHGYVDYNESYTQTSVSLLLLLSLSKLQQYSK